MNPSYIIPIVMLFVILYITRQNEQTIIKNIIQRRKHRKGATEMTEFAKRFINKECIIYTFNSQLEGVIKEVSDTAIMLEKKGTLEAVNLDFVVRIREYPCNKNGKKKSVVID